MSALVDASVIGSAYLEDERDHDACKAYLDDLLASRRRRVLAAHTLVEAHVALTRRERTAPAAAAALLRDLANRFTAVVTLSSAEHLALLRELGDQRLVGPRAYDALIAAAARKAGVREITTLNVRHFDGLWPASGLVDPRTTRFAP